MVVAMTHTTDYGTAHVYPHGVTVWANGSELRAWANRPGARWPCSELAEASEIRAHFDARGLVDFSGDDCIYLTADELNAWSSDVLREVLPTDHPAYFVTVGQYEKGEPRIPRTLEAFQAAVDEHLAEEEE